MRWRAACTHKLRFEISGISIITLLTDDPDKVKETFKEYEKLCRKDDAERKNALTIKICQALTVH